MADEFSFAYSSAFDALVFNMDPPLALDVSPSTVKRRDIHSITLTIRDAAGVAVDLTGTSVRLLARAVHRGGDAVELASSLGAGTGQVIHTLDGTLAATSYYLEVETTIQGAITTAPSDGYALLVVEADLL